MVKLIISAPVFVPAFIVRFCVWLLLVYRKRRYGYTFRRIKLSGGKYTVVDVEDYPKLAQYDWQLYESKSKNLYAVRFDNGNFIKMHRVIMNAPLGKIVDHKYGDGLNNRKVNLRIVTKAQNQLNRRKTTAKTTSKYKGVHFDKCKNKYRVAISCNYKRTFLGYFVNEIDAAKAYDEAAKKYHGEFAVLNFAAE